VSELRQGNKKAPSRKIDAFLKKEGQFKVMGFIYM
jgi:hypothetical protein